MSYMWQDFNIKTFPAETIVYRDGVFCPELSTLQSVIIDKNYNLPIHLIYVGKISGENNVNIDVLVKNQPVFITVKVESEKDTSFDIFIKNAGENSKIYAQITCFNKNNLDLNISANHFEKNTTILVNSKIIGEKNSISKMTGTANINYENCISDINLSALLDKDAKITICPAQKISAIPDEAKHSANLFEAKNTQIEYLRESGLSGAEIETILREAFINNSPLF